MGKKKEKKATKQDKRQNPPVEAPLDFRAVKRSAAREGFIGKADAPDGISGIWS